jgi:putative ABC transport system permease protein
MVKLAPLVVRNLLRNRRRSLLTLASSAVSLALLAVLFVIYQSFFHGEDYSPASTLRIICRHKVSLTQSLPASYRSRIQSIEGVETLSTWSWFGGLYKEPKNFFGRFACDPETIFTIFPDWELPKEQLEAFKRTRTGCAVSQKISEKYGVKLGDKVFIKGDIYPVNLDLTCVAIFKAPLNQENLVFHKEYLAELLKPVNTPLKDTAGTFIIRAKSTELVPRISRAVDTMFANSPQPTRTESEKEFGRSFLAMLGNIRLFIAAVCAAVTFTILLVSANTIAMSVRERTREMAILRTLGYNPTEILQLVLAESVLISLVGGVLGLGLGYLLSRGMTEASGFFLQGMRWQSATLVLVIAAVLGFVASLVPAIIASRKNIVESLRFTG